MSLNLVSFSRFVRIITYQKKDFLQPVGVAFGSKEEEIIQDTELVRLNTVASDAVKVHE